MAFLLSLASCQPESAAVVGGEEVGSLALSVTAPSLAAPAPTQWRVYVAGSGGTVELGGTPGGSVSHTARPGSYVVTVAGLAQGGVVLFGERGGVVVTAGAQTRVEMVAANAVPSPTGPTLVAPGSSATLQWTPVPGVSGGYEVQVATEPNFTTPVTLSASGPSISWSPSAAGQYHFRVRGRFGPQSLVGYWSETGVITVEAPPSIQLSATSRSFMAQAGGGNPAPQTVSVTNGGGGTLSGLLCGTISYGSGQPVGWLSCSINPTTAAATVTLSAATGGLAVGTYTATVPVTSSVASISPRTISVTLTVTAPLVPPSIQLSATSRNFTAQAGGGNPAPQTVSVTNGGGGTLSGLACGTISYGVGPLFWLTCSISPTRATATVTLSAATGGLAVGTYTATVPVTSSVASNSPRTISVTLTVAAPALGIGFSDNQFALIPAGTFQMGSTNGFGDQLPVHTVNITRQFYMQRTEVTQGQWREIMGSNPSRFSLCGDTCPVEDVSWNDIQQFLSALNARFPGRNYRLPTEAEWEYAARAGTTGDYGGTGVLDQMGWFSGNSNSRTHPAARKLPNAWGLYDMHGNVFEWVQDWYGPYTSSIKTNPTGPSTGERRVLRGGSWIESSDFARSAHRVNNTPSGRFNDHGFRLARTP